VNPKENALRIIRFDGPERVVPAPPTHSVAFYGANHEGFSGGGHHLPVGSQWTDIWGVGWRLGHAGVMGFPRYNPLADIPRALDTYVWPDPDDPRICQRIYEQAEEWDREATFLVGSHRDTLWEKSYMLTGMESMMIHFHTAPNAVKELLHRVMDFHLGVAQHYLDAGVDMVRLSDDLGTQRGLLLSPQTIAEFFLPEYRRLIDLYKSHGVLINFHSCGHIQPLVETFIDLGVDILNPVQATANNLDELRAQTQGRLALQGGVSSATIVAGPVDAIRSEVAERLWQLGRDGGYFCGPDQGMPWPERHIQALYDAVDELGTYPLRPPASSSTLQDLYAQS